MEIFYLTHTSLPVSVHKHRVVCVLVCLKKLQLIRYYYIQVAEHCRKCLRVFRSLGSNDANRNYMWGVRYADAWVVDASMYAHFKSGCICAAAASLEDEKDGSRPKLPRAVAASVGLCRDLPQSQAMAEAESAPWPPSGVIGPAVEDPAQPIEKGARVTPHTHAIPSIYPTSKPI